MRTLIVIIISILSFQFKAQEGIKTATFTVKGNCEECKERIENAGDIKGVKLLKWNDKSKIASVTFNSDKTSLLQIEQAIAAHGYDAGDVKGNESAYKKLPKCCRYRDGVCEDPKK